MNDRTYDKDFVYKHRNPYHDRLAGFEDFVLRDNEAEQFPGEWNNQIFKNKNPICMEIGSGFMDILWSNSVRNTSTQFCGDGLSFQTLVQFAKKLSRLPEQNFRYLRARGERIQHIFGESEVDRLFYFFPDPWPKSSP